MIGNPRREVLRALQDGLRDLPDGAPVLVAVSGGADSLALARAASQLARPVAAGIVDHGLQEASSEVAARAAQQCVDLGLSPVLVERVVVVDRGTGPEAAARDARRAALQEMARQVGAEAILLAHTREDQAETVLLRLSRGSGARSLAAMAPVSGPWRRPLLDVPREVVRASVADLPVWDDPHNLDPAYARVRVRMSALPALVESLGPGVIDGLARSARMLRDDAEALDALAATALQSVSDGDGLDVSGLLALPRAIRTRVIRAAAIEAGASTAGLTADHVHRVEALVADWHGQGPVDLPGGLVGERRCERLSFHPVDPVADRRRRHRKE